MKKLIFVWRVALALTICYIVIAQHAKIVDLKIRLGAVTIAYGELEDENHNLKNAAALRQYIIEQKLTALVDDIGRIWPSFRTKYEMITAEAISGDRPIEDIPSNIESLYYDYSEHMHGLSKYTLSVAGMPWPVDPLSGYVTFEFGQRHPYEGRHKGIDINSKLDVTVKAPADSYIHNVWYEEYGGSCVEIKFQIDGQWYFSRYKHLGKILVKKDALVKAGEVIGSIGGSGKGAHGNHLHWELYEYQGNARWTNINPVLNSTYNMRWVEQL